MEFKRISELLDVVSQTTKRTEKISLVSSFLRELPKSEVKPAALFLGGRIFAESEGLTLNLSWKGLLDSLHSIIEFKDGDLNSLYEGDAGEAIAALLASKGYSRQEILFQEPLTISGVKQEFSRIASMKGKGSLKEKQLGISRLLSEASPREARYLTALVLNDMRTGLSEGLLAESIAEAFSVDANLVRRAWSFSGDIGEIARVASDGGKSALESVTIKVMTAVKPMLANPLDDISEALKLGVQSYELKLDGARVQIHKDGKSIRIYSRQLNDMTDSLPDIVELVEREVKVKRVVLDGEVVAVDSMGKPYPFQIVMRRFGRTRDIEEVNQEISLKLFIFDILLLEDEMLVDLPYKDRREKLREIIPTEMIVDNLISNSETEIRQFFKKSQEEGHEGLVVKRLDSPYVPGSRGKLWFKLKHTLDTLDLVIIAAEWGHGRRSKWLSDFHLAVRNEETNEFIMIGKTFKGLTDDEFQQITEMLLEIARTKKRGTVFVNPEIVVEVLASEIQESPTYESGYALRFARIKRIRDDKSPKDATTLEELKRMYESQFKFKAR